MLLLLFLGYGIAYVDRLNISFAALQMNEALHFSATVYGFGGGLFFLSYALFEVPSNLLLIRFGARRWIARIMLTWGLIAAGMMFVRTPLQFYIMRFLLGMAEAGFFPGVIFYLTQWFPATYRGRAISRFYVAYPLSAAVMGALAGPLLALDGRWGLAGWQWLFLVEGTPAVVLGVVVLVYLTNNPAEAAWLSPSERLWIQNALRAEAARLATSAPADSLRVLLDRRVWLLGLCNVCIFGASYAFNFSAPALLKSATRWSAGEVGLLMSGSALLGALSMAFNGAHSDRRRERYLHVIIPLSVVAGACVIMGTSTSSWMVVLAYIVYYTSYAAVQAAFWLIPSDALHGRSAAVGLAALGSIGMLGAFVGPFAWGLLKDRTGNYQAGLLSLAVSFAVAATLVLLIRSLSRSARASGSSATAVT
ncbi:MAG: MFS transporter [Sinobacteraceae bacterium]|nr:MFS transporter [Nevskiaceae bacterium]